MIKKNKKSFISIASALAVTSSLMTPVFNVFAAETQTVGDFTYERTSASFGSGETSNAWKVVGYSGNAADVVIQDTTNYESIAQSDENFWNEIDAGNMIVAVEPGTFDESITSIRLPGYLSKISMNVFDEATGLTAITGAGKMNGIKGFHTDNTALYAGKALYVFPKGYSGSYEVLDETSKYASKAFANVGMDQLTLKGDLTEQLEKDYNSGVFENAKINTVNLQTTQVDEKTFLGAEIGRLEGKNTVNGSLVVDGKLIYYGFDSDFDLSGVSDISALAFQSEELFEAHINEIPEEIREHTAFRFYSGDGEKFKTRYFNINGKAAFCYNYGKANPNKVGDLIDYDETIEPDSVKYNQIRALLYGGAPNNGDALYEEIFGNSYDEEIFGTKGDAAKNVVGSLVWEIISDQKAGVSSIYGIGTNGFTEENVREYMDALRTRYINNYNSLELDNFKLGFFHPVEPSDAQNLVVINEFYRPEPPTEVAEIQISKQDITTKKELPGAKLQVIDNNGTVIDEWISTSTPHIIKNLEDGEYDLKEITAPNGYEIAESITFTVKDGKTSHNPIVMYDEVKSATPSEPDKPVKPKGPNGGWSGNKPEKLITPPDTDTPITEIKTQEETVPVPEEERTPIKTGDIFDVIKVLSMVVALGGAGLTVYTKINKREE